MPLTVVEQWRSRPDQALALAAARYAAFSAAPPPSGPPARLFRGHLDPDVLLHVAEWESRDAYAVAQRHTQLTARLDALSLVPPVCSYFHLGRSYGVMSRSFAFATCSLIRAPRGAGDATRALWSDAAGALRAVPGFAQWYSYSDEDDPDHFMTITEWESAAAAQAFLDGPGLNRMAQLGQAEAVVESFVQISYLDPPIPPA